MSHIANTLGSKFATFAPQLKAGAGLTRRLAGPKGPASLLVRKLAI